MRPALILALTFALAGPVAADCLTASSGAKCVTAAATEAGTEGAIRFLKAPVRPAPFGVGDILPDGYSILLNTDYYGLPPATDGWRCCCRPR